MADSIAYDIPMTSSVNGAANVNPYIMNQDKPDIIMQNKPVPLGSMDQITSDAYSLSSQKEKFKEAQNQREELAKDKQVITMYLKTGGSLVSPDDLDKAQGELKGMLSPSAYDQLGQLADQKRLKLSQIKEFSAKGDAANVKASVDRSNQVLHYMSMAVGAYDQVKANGGTDEDATQAFNSAKVMAAQLAGSDFDPSDPTKPLIPSQYIDRFKDMTYQQVKALHADTKLNIDAMKAGAQATSAGAKATTAEAVAGEKKFGKAAYSAINIDESVKSGKLSPQEGAEYKQIAAAADLSSPTLDPADIKRLAASFVSTGDPKVFPIGMSRGKHAEANITAIQHEITEQMASQNLPPEESQKRRLAFEGALSGERSLGRRGSVIDAIAEEVNTFADNAVKSFEVVSNMPLHRGKVVPLNDIMAKYYKGMSSGPEADLAVRMTSLAGAYASILSRGTAPTEPEIKTAQSILAKNYGKEGFYAMIKAVQSEAKGIQGATKTTQSMLPGTGVVPSPGGKQQVSNRKPASPAALQMLNTMLGKAHSDEEKQSIQSQFDAIYIKN